MKCITVESPEYMRAHMFPVRRIACGSRGARVKPTAEAQAKYNDKMAYHRLSDKVEANFTPNDWILTLTYDNAHLPQDVDGAVKRFAAYIRRLRRLMERKGSDPKALKYINITQQGSKGGRLHHHVFLSAPGITYEELNLAWGLGHTDIKHLEFNEEGIRGLAEYVLEGRATVKRWTSSHNLVEPVVKDHGPYALSKKQVQYINDNPTDIAYIEKLFPGWHVSRVEGTPGCPDALGLFVCVYFYRDNNAFFRYGRWGRIDYTYRPRTDC